MNETMTELEKYKAAADVYDSWVSCTARSDDPPSFADWVSKMIGQATMALVARNIPRNPVDYSGGYVLYSWSSDLFYRISWGTGDNLTKEDADNGYDSYIMYDVYRPDGTLDHDGIVGNILTDGFGEFLDGVKGLEEVDGGMHLVKTTGKDGDLRLHFAAAFEGYLFNVEDLVMVNRFN